MVRCRSGCAARCAARLSRPRSSPALSSRLVRSVMTLVIWSLTLAVEHQMRGFVPNTVSATTQYRAKGRPYRRGAHRRSRCFRANAAYAGLASVPQPASNSSRPRSPIFHRRHRHACQSGTFIDRVLVIGFDEAGILAIQRGPLLRELRRIFGSSVIQDWYSHQNVCSACQIPDPPRQASHSALPAPAAVTMIAPTSPVLASRTEST